MSCQVHSNDLMWQLVRKNNKYLVKRNGAVFSTEPANLTNKHSPKFSGLVSSNPLGVVARKNGALLVTKSNSKNGYKRPGSRTAGTRLHNNKKTATAKLQKVLASYSLCCQKLALARLNKVLKSQRRKVATVKAAQQ